MSATGEGKAVGEKGTSIRRVSAPGGRVGLVAVGAGVKNEISQSGTKTTSARHGPSRSSSAVSLTKTHRCRSRIPTELSSGFSDTASSMPDGGPFVGEVRRERSLPW